MTFDNFVKTYIGKGTDVDGAYGVQCVDLAKLYVDKCKGIKAGSWGNAHCWYDDFEKIPALKNSFTRIENSSSLVPKRGDICVWKSSLNNGSGHISIATGKGNTLWFTSYDQNWGGKPMKEVRHSYKNFAGVLRPKEWAYIYPNAKTTANVHAYGDKTITIPKGSKLYVYNYAFTTKTIGSKKYIMAQAKFEGKVYLIAKNWIKCC